MAKQQKPKKPRKNKRLKLTITERDKWKQILKEVEKAEAPVSVLHTITVNLKDGTKVEINVQELLAEGLTPDFLEKEINHLFQTQLPTLKLAKWETSSQEILWVPSNLHRPQGMFTSIFL